MKWIVQEIKTGRGIQCEDEMGGWTENVYVDKAQAQAKADLLNKHLDEIVYEPCLKEEV